MSIDKFIFGKGLVIGSKEFWGALSTTADVRFVDKCDLVQIRRSRADLREEALSPIDIIDKSGSLPGIEETSIDYIIDWSVRPDKNDTRRRLSAAARVLRAGASLLIPVHDEKYLPSPLHEPQWPANFGNFVSAVAAAVERCEAPLELAHISRCGILNIAVLRKTSKLTAPAIIACGERVYLLDGVCLRHVTSLRTLDRLHAVGMPSFEILEAERSMFAEGHPLHEGEVTSLFAKLDIKE